MSLRIFPIKCDRTSFVGFPTPASHALPGISLSTGGRRSNGSARWWTRRRRNGIMVALDIGMPACMTTGDKATNEDAE